MAPRQQTNFLIPSGVDTDGDGKNDCFTGDCVAEIKKKVSPPEGYKVIFDSVATSGGPLFTREEWEVAGGIQVKYDIALGHRYAYFPEEAAYKVKLTVWDAAGNSTSKEKVVTIQDWLIVALGDSYSSGEANPDRVGSIVPLAASEWADRRCHRSGWSWPTLIAWQIEDADPKTSVTLLHLGCGGAEIDASNGVGSGGIISSYVGTEPPAEGVPPIPPQLDQGKELIGNRTIDAMVVSIGGNDIGFAQIALKCVYDDRCDLDTPPSHRTADEICSYMGPLYSVCMGPQGLPGEPLPEVSAKRMFDILRWGGTLAGTERPALSLKYAAMAAKIDEKLGIPSDRVFIGEYPRPTRDEDDNICQFKLWEPLRMLPLWEWEETYWAETYAQWHLNWAVSDAADTHGWHFVSGITAAFNKHGYCAEPDEYPAGGDPGTWFVRLQDSLVHQHGYQGTMHPNRKGHATMAGFYKTTLDNDFYIDGSAASGLKRKPRQPRPTIDIGTSYSLTEGQSLQATNTSTNLDGSPMSFLWFVWDGCAEKVKLSDRTAAQPILQALDDCSGFLELQVEDSAGKTLKRVPLTVANAAPKVSFLDDLKVGTEGHATWAQFKFADAGALDTHTATLDWGDGIVQTLGAVSTGTVITLSHEYRDNGNYSLRATVTDDDGGKGTADATAAVPNARPVVAAITGLGSPLQALTATANASAAFTDAGLSDTHTAVWDWGDGSTSAGTVTETDGSGSVTGQHVYAQGGTYAVRLTVKDKDGGTGESVFDQVIVTDPRGGFTNGSGWFETLVATGVGAKPAKGTFDFIARYLPGETGPSGGLTLSMPATGLAFAGVVDQWLVVSSPTAFFKGSGTVNGLAGYSFVFSAIDGALTTPRSADRIRIRIWNTASGAVVFDTQPGNPDLALPVTATGGGNITVH